MYNINIRHGIVVHLDRKVCTSRDNKISRLGGSDSCDIRGKPKKFSRSVLSENHQPIYGLPGPHDALALPLPVVGAQHVGPRHPGEDPGLGHGHGEHLVTDQRVLTVIIVNTWQRNYYDVTQ